MALAEGQPGTAAAGRSRLTRPLVRRRPAGDQLTRANPAELALPLFGQPTWFPSGRLFSPVAEGKFAEEASEAALTHTPGLFSHASPSLVAANLSAAGLSSLAAAADERASDGGGHPPQRTRMGFWCSGSEEPSSARPDGS